MISTSIFKRFSIDCFNKIVKYHFYLTEILLTLITLSLFLKVFILLVFFSNKLYHFQSDSVKLIHIIAVKKLLHINNYFVAMFDSESIYILFQCVMKIIIY